MLEGDKVSVLTNTYPHKSYRKIKLAICHHQVDSPLYVWSSVWSNLNILSLLQGNWEQNGFRFQHNGFWWRRSKYLMQKLIESLSIFTGFHWTLVQSNLVWHCVAFVYFTSTVACGNVNMIYFLSRLLITLFMWFSFVISHHSAYYGSYMRTHHTKSIKCL